VARPKKHWPMVEASRDEASLAVGLYNDATDIRSFEGFVVHMHLAWALPPPLRVHPGQHRLPLLEARQPAPS